MKKNYEENSINLKRDILEIACMTKTHHIGSFLSAADLMAVLYTDILRINPKNPNDPKRDHFILSKGHASLALYVALMQKGFFSKEKLLKEYAVNGGSLGFHPDRNVLPGIDATTGSLGHGLSIGAGLALAAKKDKRKSRVFVMLGDGECNEGSIWEAIMFAGHHGLDNLVAIVDRNNLQGFGFSDEVINLEPFSDRWKSFGWAVREIDGHNLEEISKVFKSIPFEQKRPSVVIANTIKGRGIPHLENKLESHYATVQEDELEDILRNIHA